jgi:hypothetical protein
MQFENMKLAIDGFAQFQTFDQHLHGSYSAVEHAPVATSDFIVDVTWIEYRTCMYRPCSFVEAFAHFPLALPELFCYCLFHSK